MYNTLSYNALQYNWEVLQVVPEGDTIQINWYGLQNAKICTDTPGGMFNWPIVDYNSFAIPQNDGKWFISKFDRNKNIIIRGHIIASDEEELFNLTREIKTNAYVNNAILKYKNVWLDKFLQITWNTVSFEMPRQHYNITHSPYIIQFETTDAYFHEKNEFSSIYESQTSNIAGEETNTWSAETKPILYLAFSSWISGVTSISFTVNSTTITISETISDNDLLVIDCRNFEVLLNNVITEYTWTFPEFGTWTNFFTISINGTYTVDAIVNYRINYR